MTDIQAQSDMIKHYAKKRTPIRAVQWNGEMTPEALDLVGERAVRVDKGQLEWGRGWEARVGDWIYSTSGEDLAVISDEVFRKVYEEVDETGRAAPPTDDEHEAAGREFVQELDALLLAGLRLAREEHPQIFHNRDQLVRSLRYLLEDHVFIAERRERQRIREKITKELEP